MTSRHITTQPQPGTDDSQGSSPGSGTPLAVPQDSYASIADVERRVLREFPDTGTQSRDNIAGLLREGKRRIDAALKILGAPFGAEFTTAVEVLRTVNADFAAERVFSSQRERYPATRVHTSWREDLRAIRAGEIDLGLEEDETSFYAFIGGMTYSG